MDAKGVTGEEPIEFSLTEHLLTNCFGFHGPQCYCFGLLLQHHFQAQQAAVFRQKAVINQ